MGRVELAKRLDPDSEERAEQLHSAPLVVLLGGREWLARIARGVFLDFHSLGMR